MAKKKSTKRGTETVPLSRVSLLLYPLIVRNKTGSELQYWEERRALAWRINKQKAERAAIQKKLAAEAKLYSAILREEWARLGGFFAARWRDIDVDGRSRRRVKIRKVHFEIITTTPEALWFRIKINAATLFGAYKSALPHKVLVKDLIDPVTLQELSDACRRPVTAKRSEKGVYIIVHRNGNISAIPEMVKLRDMLPHLPSDAGEKGTVILGIGEYRQVHLVDLDHYPHFIVAGASGGGKSNMLNSLLCQLIRMTSADDLRLRLIDPKRLELTFYRSAPHLDGGIIYDVDEAITSLEDMILEVHHRTEMFEGKARKLSEWNGKFPAKKLPRIVIVVEEMAALMRSAKEADIVKEKLTTLANLGRAVGIHLLLCTQLPIVSIVPSAIKVSMWVRISGRVQNPTESVTILGTGDASSLPAIPGRMMYGKDSFRYQMQTPFCTDDDVDSALAIAKGRRTGWITLEGYLPVIHVPNLIYALCWSPVFGRELNPYRIHGVLKQYEISQRQVRSFVEDLVRKGQIQVEDAIFNICADGKYWRFEPANQAAQQPLKRGIFDDYADAGSFRMSDEFKLTWKRIKERRSLAAPPQQLMLPPPSNIIEAQIVDEPITIAPKPQQPTSGTHFNAFLNDCVEVDWNSRTSFRDIYNAYEAWWTETAQSKGWNKLNDKNIGILLGKAGFLRSRKGEKAVRSWDGVSLKKKIQVGEVGESIHERDDDPLKEGDIE